MIIVDTVTINNKIHACMERKKKWGEKELNGNTYLQINNEDIMRAQ